MMSGTPENKKVKTYECDPDKNKECRKTNCMFNMDIVGSSGPCHRTTDPKYAWDGKTRRKFKRRTNNGEN